VILRIEMQDQYHDQFFIPVEVFNFNRQRLILSCLMF
jgi:hypothetical protein